MQKRALESFNFEQLQKHVPELQRFAFRIDTYQFDPPMDSSDMDPDAWRKLVRIISNNYNQYTGFVILHGTDTMAYTASALSFMLEGLNKPVILTGSQLPIGVLRTDGKGKPADQHRNSHRPPLQRTAHRTRSLHLLRKPPDARQPYHQNERGELQCFSVPFNYPVLASAVYILNIIMCKFIRTALPTNWSLIICLIPTSPY